MKLRVPIFALTVFLLMGLLAIGSAQTPKIIVQGLSHGDLEELGWESSPSTGLTTVGKGELVYLSGRDLAGEAVTAYEWSLTTVPTGDATTLDSTDTEWTTFRPGMIGTYVVQLTITTATGTASTTVTIISADYAGVGNVDSLMVNPVDTKNGNCFCHYDRVEQWAGTGHSLLFQQGINGVASDHYAESCIECHTLGYDTDPTAVNHGFDDVASDLGWVFPAHPQAGEWDTLVVKYSRLAPLASIQCENCHGPASEHQKQYNPTKMAVSMDQDVCGRCHDEPWRHFHSKQWKNSPHNYDQYTAAHGAPTREDCGVCHSALGFAAKFDSNLEFDPAAPGNISCAACHEPHTAELHSTATVTLENGDVISDGGTGKLCMNCHRSRRDAATYTTQYASHFGPHEGPQADVLAGTNAVTFGQNIPSSTHIKVVGNSCVTCHMAPTPGDGVAPNPSDPSQYGRDHIGGHTFMVSYTGDQGEVDLVGACQTCHGNVTSFADFKASEDYDADGNIESIQDEVKGMLEEIGMLLPPLNEETVTVTADYTPVQLKAAYNYLMIEADGSFGIHNAKFTIGLLKATYNALTTGDLGAGMIEEISDVPNDQGRQVRIVWSRFSGDGAVDNPIQNYVIWRKADMNAAPANVQNTAKSVYISLEQLSSASLDENAALQLNGEVWDFAGEVPAGGNATYSAIVPTLYDSTKTDGQHWSYFIVTGYTSVPAMNMSTAPDSGYSVDNLAPTAPSNVNGQITASGITLTWDESTDADFNYFAIYRSTSPNFSIQNMEPIANTTDVTYTDAEVSANESYYYKVAAFDFSGNESQTSSEVAVTYTGIGDKNNQAVPTDFVLQQNFPNPFNPSTHISFGLPNNEEVRIIIYDMLGKPIRTLVSGKLSAGFHDIVWNGRDHNGNVVSAGVYIYRLEAKSHVLTKKMLLVK